MRSLRLAPLLAPLLSLVAAPSMADAGLLALDGIVRAACACAEQRRDGLDAALSCGKTTNEYGVAEVHYRDSWGREQKVVEQRLRMVLEHCLSRARPYVQSLDALGFLESGLGGEIPMPPRRPTWYRSETDELAQHIGSLARVGSAGGETFNGLIEAVTDANLMLRLSRDDGGGLRLLPLETITTDHHHACAAPACLAMSPATALAPLGWLGRQGPRAVAGVLIVALLFPSLGQWLRPFAGEAVFALLSIAFLRLDPALALAALRRPAMVLAAIAWTSVAIPALMGGAALALGLREGAPELFLGLVLQGAASPMMAAPALVALVGLDATLVLIVMVGSSLLVPLTASLMAFAFLGDAASMDASQLALRLTGLVLGSASLGLGLRRLLGPARVLRHDAEIGGMNVVIMYVFAAAVMQTVPASVARAPLATLGVMAVAMLVSVLLLAVTTALFMAAGRERALALGLMASLRNMGLMIAATGGALPEATWLYFGMSQFPIHLAPWYLQWWMSRRQRRSIV
jgi:BASS family bile acid:Na+ symporter